MSAERVSLRAVVRTGVALLVLWGASFALSYVPLGEASLPVALGIAAVKAALVGLFFMELVAETFSIKVTMLSAGALVAVLIGLMVADVATRRTPALMAPGMPAAGGAARLPSK